jgi:serine/threonine-protein kinase
VSFPAGSRIGHYELIAQIGAGGMGEVYRATDTNLGRQVAIKLLPEAFAQDAERLARFEREARTLASLNHPNIASIHGLERSGSVPALVMELVEGPALADRIAAGPIPPGEALAIADQIADALDAAHELGIVHRDLKPANIKVRPDGTVKVLDFGLAKAVEPAGATSGLSLSPTITSPVMTGAGILLGTAAYMSPEQARAKPVDKRTDIWAFGAVLYEMLTGRRAFAGDDVSDVLASVLAREPDWDALPLGLPPRVAVVIRRCLSRDQKQRVRDIGDVRLALKGAFDIAVNTTASADAVPRPLWRRTLPLVGCTAIGVTIAALAAWRLWPASEPTSVTRFVHTLPEGQELRSTQRPVIAVAPDGQSFVYLANPGGLHVRSMSEMDARLIPGTVSGSASPFFSPDGQWIGFFEGAGQAGGPPSVAPDIRSAPTSTPAMLLKKISVTGGTPITISNASVPFGASWSSDNTILFGQQAGIMRVSADGGTPELLIKAGDNEQLYGPQLLPGGDAVLFSVTTGQGPNRWNQAQVVVQSVTSGQRTVVVKEGTEARYVSSGHLVYTVRDTLFGMAFDAKRLAVLGAARPLGEYVDLPVGVAAAGANYAVSDRGTLAYVSRTESLRSLIWTDRSGTMLEEIKTIPPDVYEDPRLSPDGSRVLVTRDGDIWIFDIASGRSSRATRDGVSLMGVWDPTGSRVAYSSASGGNLEAWVVPIDGSAEPRQVTTLGGQIHVDSWSPDGRLLTLHRHAPEGEVQMFMVPLDEADGKPRRFAEGIQRSEGADFSSDLRYVTYLGMDSGQREVYLRPYPGPGGQVTVSIGGAREPVWSPNGEIFYRNAAGDRMFAVSVTTAPTLKVGPPVQLFERPYYVAPTGSPRPNYDVTADGQRFVMLTLGRGLNADVSSSRIVVVQNWPEELRRLLPVN